MTNCPFCIIFNEVKKSSEVIKLDFDHFIAMWDNNPSTPGHALVVPKRHVQFMKDLTVEEQASLLPAVLKVKAHIKACDIRTVTENIIHRLPGTPSAQFASKMLTKIEQNSNRPPDAFNDGINDGPAAGQSVAHFHWHILPRWKGDVANPRGGIRHMFNGMGNY